MTSIGSIHFVVDADRYQRLCRENMPKPKKIYAVARGKNGEGIYHSWPDCQEQVKGHKGARYKGFATREECEDFIRENRLQIVGTSIRNPIAVTENPIETGTVPYCRNHTVLNLILNVNFALLR